MNIYLRTTLWILGVPLILLFLGCILSGFDLTILVIGGYVLGIGVLPLLLFVSSCFICGLKGKKHLNWAIGTILVYGAANYIIPSPLFEQAADPEIIYSVLYIFIIFTLAFGCGYLWRLGIQHSSSYLYGAAKYIGSLCAAIVLGYIGIANLGDLGFDSSHWIEPHYNDNKTLFYEQKLRLSPFPARVVGVRYYNKHGHFAGASASQPCNYRLADMRLGETPDGSADILLHNKYIPMVTELLADFRNAYRKETEKATIYLYYKNDTLHRIETEHYENGIISVIRKYDPESIADDYESIEFDELGTPQKMFFNASDRPRLWRINDFRVEKEVPRFNYGTDNPNDPQLDERLRKELDWNTTFEKARHSLKAMGESGDNLSVTLFLKGFSMSKDTTISVAIDADSYYGYSRNIGFTSMKAKEEMETVGDALSLCGLESSIAEHRPNRYDEQSYCPRIRIQENSERDKYLIIYLMKDYAVSSDFKYRFVYNPLLHTDKKKQEDAARLWKKMHQLADSYKEASN